MSIILLLIPLSLAVALVFLFGFVWAVRSGQYEDTCTPSFRILTDDTAPATASPIVATEEPKENR